MGESDNLIDNTFYTHCTTNIILFEKLELEYGT